MSSPLELVAPRRCLSCRRRGRTPWCDGCEQLAEQLRRPGACVRCAGDPGEGHPCWPAGAMTDRTVAVYRYATPVSDAIVAAKVRGASQAWAELGSRLAAVCSGLEVDVVSWIPSTPRARRRRGLDHARALATPVARRLGVPLAALLAARPRPDQAGRSTARRRQLAPDAFTARSPGRTAARVAGARVLLVDDVLTTGATLEVATRVLVRRLGVAEVVAAVLARAGDHALGTAPQAGTGG